MGCDIHLHIEVKIAGRWEHYGAPNIDRWYGLFEKMAGVCGDDENAISAPKGMPDDLNAVTLADCNRLGSDGHSHSWLDADEIVLLDTWLREKEPPKNDVFAFDLEHGILRTYFFGNSFAIPADRRKQEFEPEGIQDLRFVFWFDN